MDGVWPHSSELLFAFVSRNRGIEAWLAGLMDSCLGIDSWREVYNAVAEAIRLISYFGQQSSKTSGMVQTHKRGSSCDSVKSFRGDEIDDLNLEDDDQACQSYTASVCRNIESELDSMYKIGYDKPDYDWQGAPMMFADDLATIFNRS